MIVNKNSNQSQPLKTHCLHYEWWVNTDLKKFNDIKHFSLSA